MLLCVCVCVCVCVCCVCVCACVKSWHMLCCVCVSNGRGVSSRGQISHLDNLKNVRQKLGKTRNEKNPFQVVTDRHIAKQHGRKWSLCLDGAMASFGSGTLSVSSIEQKIESC